MVTAAPINIMTIINTPILVFLILHLKINYSAQTSFIEIDNIIKLACFTSMTTDFNGKQSTVLFSKVNKTFPARCSGTIFMLVCV